MSAHEMMVVTSTGSTQTWECMICPRTVLVRSWDPFTREVLCEGQHVPHYGASGPVTFSGRVRSGDSEEGK